jgi:hypothetical protein
VFGKLEIGTTDMCTCGLDKMLAYHLLHTCPMYRAQREQIWPSPVLIQDQLYDEACRLQQTAAIIKFVQVDNAEIYAKQRERSKQLIWQTYYLLYFYVGKLILIISQFFLYKSV